MLTLLLLSFNLFIIIDVKAAPGIQELSLEDKSRTDDIDVSSTCVAV
jgi:hypothetical protein